MIYIITDCDDARVTFQYDANAVEIIREVPGRRWHGDDKCWRIPKAQVEFAERLFLNAGFTVDVDGQSQSQSQSGNPFNILFDAVPADLRTAAYKALAKILHPDVGGSHALMQQLNESYNDN